jgi:hypothetical protein
MNSVINFAIQVMDVAWHGEEKNAAMIDLTALSLIYDL